MKQNNEKNNNTEIILNSYISFLRIMGVKIIAKIITQAALFPKKSSSVILVRSVIKDFNVSAKTIKYISINPALLNIKIPLIQNIDFLPNKINPIS